MFAGARADNETTSDESTSSKSETQRNDEVNITSTPSARLLIQTLIDNGIINANNKATVRIIDNSKALDINVQKNIDTKIILPGNVEKVKSELNSVKTFNLGSFIIKQDKSVDNPSTSGRKEIVLDPPGSQINSTKIGDQLKNSNVRLGCKTDLVFQQNSEQEGGKQGRKFLVQNQNSGNFIRICQSGSGQGVLLESLGNVGIVQSGSQGNLVFPVGGCGGGGGNLIHLSDGSLVIPVHRLDSQKRESETKRVFRLDGDERTDESGYGAIVFSQSVDRTSASGGTLMDSEPPPLLILPTEEQQAKAAQNSGESVA